MVLMCNMFCQGFSVIAFSSQTVLLYFYHKKSCLIMYFTYQVKCCHFFIVEIIVESVNLIQMSKQNRKVLSLSWRTIKFLRNCACTLSKPLQEVIVMHYEKMKTKYMKEDVWKSFFCKLTGWYLATSLRIN